MDRAYLDEVRRHILGRITSARDPGLPTSALTPWRQLVTLAHPALALAGLAGHQLSHTIHAQSMGTIQSACHLKIATIAKTAQATTNHAKGIGTLGKTAIIDLVRY